MNILVIYDNNDCLTTKINCNIEEAKTYYINKSLIAGGLAKMVIDIDKPFTMDIPKMNISYQYQFMGIHYDQQIDFRIHLKNLTTNEITEVEPNWFLVTDRKIT